MSEPKRELYCSFCGKSQHEVTTLIAGPQAFICNECVALSVTIVQPGVTQDLIKLRRWAVEQAVAVGAYDPVESARAIEQYLVEPASGALSMNIAGEVFDFKPGVPATDLQATPVADGDPS